MKIFHALLGYLVVIAPFNQVVFVSPAGVPVVGHDGNTNALQQRSDARLKQDPRELAVTPRQELPAYVAITLVGLAAIAALAWVVQDDPKRRRYTKRTVNNLYQKWPKFNWVVYHGSYTPEFDGAQGKDWGHTHQELPISFGRTIGYDLVWTRSGKITLNEDAGFINVAYEGHVAKVESNGKVIHFGTL